MTGTKGHFEQVVTPELTAAHVGSGLAPVFATPMMISMMEQTCSDSVAPLLKEGESTVGTKIDITHDAATPVGMKVWCDSELVEVDRRRLVFEVKAYDEKGLIGQGRHERFVIDYEKFMAKVNAKRDA
ncbi:MAG: thioesterase family protein [Bacteroidales bacterium]|nr:thioesterase family protein [Bacteroidales bacterium]